MAELQADAEHADRRHRDTSNNTNGNIKVGANSLTDTIQITGTATASNFGIRTLTGLPSNQQVLGLDTTAFLNQTIGGGAITAYDQSGSPVNMQLRWGKVDSAALGTGHSDIWNLFYQVDSNATGNAGRVAERRRELQVRRQRPDESADRQHDAQQRHGERHCARHAADRSWLGRHDAVLRYQRHRAGEPDPAGRLPGGLAADDRDQRQGPRGRHLLERPHARSRRGHARELQRRRTSSSGSTAARSR